MIDVSKAKTIVSALQNLKKEVQAKPDLLKNKGVFSDAKSVSELGISVLEDKRLSLNLAAYQRTLDSNKLPYDADPNPDVHSASEGELAPNSADGSVLPRKKPRRKTQKQIYEEEMRRKRREWRQFLTFMKKNPEVLIGIAE